MKSGLSDFRISARYFRSNEKIRKTLKDYCTIRADNFPATLKRTPSTFHQYRFADQHCALASGTPRESVSARSSNRETTRERSHLAKQRNAISTRVPRVFPTRKYTWGDAPARRFAFRVSSSPKEEVEKASAGHVANECSMTRCRRASSATTTTKDDSGERMNPSVSEFLSDNGIGKWRREREGREESTRFRIPGLRSAAPAMHLRRIRPRNTFSRRERDCELCISFIVRGNDVAHRACENCEKRLLEMRRNGARG